jgi:anaphase-promoting complex subunit 1
MGISIPKVELSAKIVPSVSYLAPSADGLAPEEKTWPYFHSGVATALHIAWSKEEFDASEYAFHRPAELNARHGGFLLGLGLTGQIRSLGTYQAFKYLDPKHEYTSIGLLLGLGASYMGTADPKVSSTLSVHTSALHPPTAAPLNVSLSLQASGLVAMGLVHVASRNRGIADNILRDLTRIHITGTEHPDGCLEAYAIASGFSYGLVMLGKGNEYSGPSDANILSTFKYLLEGGRGTHLPGAKRNVEGVLDAAITSPAATIALALTFMRTNRRDVADLLEIPQTIDRLDHVRNDLVLLRSACRLLITWDALRCTKKSVESLVPAFMQQSTQQREQLKAPVPSDSEVAYWHVIAGACLALGLKYAGSAKVEAHSVMIEYLDKLARKTASITGMALPIRHVSERFTEAVIVLKLRRH